MGTDRQPCVELALQGRLMNAAEAKQPGFVNKIVEQSNVHDAALDAARRLAKQPRLAYRRKGKLRPSGGVVP
ncbi:enoyl-CoA hydratase-related protein [Bradyrhizobium sp. CIR18]|uniref:enoyl-CoA hydratase-related protein n=1 Tax=Bradyrhizobium sp. CIR18 TaxID=2663839 RepID=UPI003908AD19